MALREHENSCTGLISLSKNNLNLASPLCLVASSTCSSCCHAHSLAALRLFIVFEEADFEAQPSPYPLVNLKAGFHLSYLADRENITEQVCWVYI